MTLDEALVLCEALPTIPAPPGFFWKDHWQVSIRDGFYRVLISSADDRALFVVITYDEINRNSSERTLAHLAEIKQEAAVAFAIVSLIEGLKL